MEEIKAVLLIICVSPVSPQFFTKITAYMAIIQIPFHTHILGLIIPTLFIQTLFSYRPLSLLKYKINTFL